MSNRTKVIAVATQKGGAGKSTIAIHLAVQAMQSKKNAQVVLLDLDPQGSIAGCAARREIDDPIVLSAMPGNLEAYLQHAREDRANYVVIDTPPHAGATIDAAIRAADLVVIPIRPGPFDIDAAGGTIEIMRETRTPGLFVLSQVSATGAEGDDTEAVLADLHPSVPVAKARLGHRKAFMQALISGQAITEFERPSSKAVGEIQALFREVRSQMGSTTSNFRDEPISPLERSPFSEVYHMQLSTFRIMNYRSIQDSGEIDASRITALLGRNESGKSNLLRALTHVNPVGGMQPLNEVKDFPRNRRLEDCSEYTRVAVTTWMLDKQERAQIAKIWPRAQPGEPITVTRYYGAKRGIGIPHDDLPFDTGKIEKALQRIAAGVKAAASRVEDAEAKSGLETAAETFKAAASPQEEAESWAEAALAAIDTIQTELAKVDEELTEKQEEFLTELHKDARAIVDDEDAHIKARRWVGQRLPVFVYFDDYPEIPGHQNIPAFLQRKATGNLETADENFEKLCKIAGLDPTRLHELQKSDTEQRNQLANRASSVVSAELQKRWTDRKVKVRFNLDGDDLQTFVSDTAHTFDVDVNLNERSRGFQWFFSFYTAFAADTDNGDKDTAILLLDEPGLYLHAKSQGDLLTHLEDDFENQILYTTHSPFMVPTKHLDWVRTVNIAEADGTTVTNNPSGDRKTLFPLQAALGYDLTQSLFLGGSNLIVEGVTDFWILSAVSEYLASQGRQSLDESLTITPAGGAQKIPYMAALLASENLNVLVLLDHEKDAISTREDLLKTKVLRENNILSIGDAFEENARPKDADIEDLLDAEVYEKLVRDSHTREIGKKKLTVNGNIPRLAKRMEQALKGVDVEFSKTRPARLFLEKVGQSPADVLTTDALNRFERLIVAINEKLARHIARDAGAFH